MDFVGWAWFDGARVWSGLEARRGPKIKLPAKGLGQDWMGSEWSDGQITDHIFFVPNLWNHGVSAQGVCKIFDQKNLDPKIFQTKDLGTGRRLVVRPSRPRPGLRGFFGGARSDVTMGVWKTSGLGVRL